MELWSDLAAKLQAARSLPEAAAAYQSSMARRRQMAADDGRRLSEDCEAVMKKNNDGLNIHGTADRKHVSQLGTRLARRSPKNCVQAMT